MALNQDHRPNELGVGEAVRVFCQTHGRWFAAEVVQFEGDYQVRVEFVADGMRCGKTLHIRSEQLATPTGPTREGVPRPHPGRPAARSEAEESRGRGLGPVSCSGYSNRSDCGGRHGLTKSEDLVSRSTASREASYIRSFGTSMDGSCGRSSLRSRSGSLSAASQERVDKSLQAFEGDADFAEDPRPLEKRDPRWDTVGFAEWCEDAQVAWAKAGYLRGLVAKGRPCPRRQELPPVALHVGAPPPGARLYSATSRWAAPEDADKGGFVSTKLVQALDGDAADDGDLVFWDWCSFFQDAGGVLAEEEQVLLERQLQHVSFMHLFFQIKCIILPDTPEDGIGFFETGLCVFVFCISTFTQRIANAGHSAVRAHMTPEWLMKTEKMMLKAKFQSDVDRDTIVETRRNLGARMKPASTDALGFQMTCRACNFAWIRVSFIHELAARDGPAPRRQDLPPGTHVMGAVPPGCRPWVVSYAWAAALHSSPSGVKVKELSSVLKELEAKPSDIVFMDYLSMWQGGNKVPEIYAKKNPHAVTEPAGPGLVQMSPLTPADEKKRRFALFECTRLYAFAGGKLPNGEEVLGCKVIVLPRIEGPEAFPDAGDIRKEENTFCEDKREEFKTTWGFAKSVPYEKGGWTCAEYAVARKNGTIANGHHKDVRRIDQAHNWPRNAAEFSAMMEATTNRLSFTRKEDRECVHFNFYKYSYHILEEV